MAALNGQVWDASSLLNLLATGHAEEILSGLGQPSYIVRQVHEMEVFFLRPFWDDPDPDALKPINLLPLFSSKLLIEVEMGENEIESFIEYASEMDDGEARSLAVAFYRGCILFADDRAAIRHAPTLSPPVLTATTPVWLQSWSESRQISASTLSEVIRRVEICARFRPRPTHPLRTWWDTHR